MRKAQSLPISNATIMTQSEGSVNCRVITCGERLVIHAQNLKPFGYHTGEVNFSMKKSAACILLAFAVSA